MLFPGNRHFPEFSPPPTTFGSSSIAFLAVSLFPSKYTAYQKRFVKWGTSSIVRIMLVLPLLELLAEVHEKLISRKSSLTSKIAFWTRCEIQSCDSPKIRKLFVFQLILKERKKSFNLRPNLLFITLSGWFKFCCYDIQLHNLRSGIGSLWIVVYFETIYIETKLY